MIEMDWIWGFAGGLLIGGAGALFLLVNGRIMGASGILGGLVDGSGRSNRSERLAFLGGLVLFPPLLTLVYGNVDTRLTDNVWLLVAAGLLVGFGTRIANGCTSGHGVCGISRLSLRGLAATLVYIVAGGLAVVAFRHWLGVV
jgi:uncharacterized protein